MEEKFIENGIEYVKCGDYYVPNLRAPTQQYQIGKYGKLHGKFIKEHHRAFYSILFMTGKWFEYLTDIDAQANEMVDSLVKQTVIKQGITEELKATDQMKWVGLMNNIKHSVEETVSYTHLLRTLSP